MKKLILIFGAVMFLAGCAGVRMRHGVDVTITELSNGQKFYACSLDVWRPWSELEGNPEGVTRTSLTIKASNTIFRPKA